MEIPRNLVWIPVLAAAAFAQTPVLTTFPNPSSFAQEVTVTAMVGGGATGRVTFYDGVNILGTGVLSGGQALLKAPFLLDGPHSLKARYDGDATHQPATSPVVTQTVSPSSALGFAQPVSSNTGMSGTYLVQADFNGDGIPDLAAAGPSSLIVSLGNGDGTFRAGMKYTVATANPSGLLAADFNGDGIPDLAVGGTVVSILLGNGDGTFQSGPSPAFAADAGMVTGDFNGDGIADLALASGTLVTFAGGNGDGTFRQTAAYTFASTVTSMAVADFNGDGKADAAVFCLLDTLNVLLGNGDGSMGNPIVTAMPANQPYNFAAAADLNGDGKIDLVAVSATPSPAIIPGGVFLGNGDGTFTLAAGFGQGLSSDHYYLGGGLALVDLNGDGKPDVVCLYLNSLGGNGGVLTFLGNGDGTFQPSDPHTGFAAPSNLGAFAVGDFNGDGIPDVAMAAAGTSPMTYTMAGVNANLETAIASSGIFAAGQTATITLTVSNPAGGMASGEGLSVTASLPSSLTVNSIAGTGWACGGTACSRNDSLAPGASFPPIAIAVSVGASSGSYTVQATLSGGGSATTTVTGVIPQSPAPGTPVLTGPANGSMIAASQVELTWTPGVNSTAQDLYLGTANPPPLFQANVPGSPLYPSGLLTGTTYYWQIVDRNASGSAASAIWSFTTVTMCASIAASPIELSPAAQTGTIGVTAPAGCAWAAGSDAPWLTISSGPGLGNGQVSFSVTANTGLARLGTVTVQGTSATVTQDAEGLGFLAIAPCRIVDTRGATGVYGGPPMSAGQTRTFNVPASACGIPALAQAYALNITVVPPGTLNYLTVWPAGTPQPLVSTLNSYQGYIVAGAAIVPAASGAISVYVTDATDLIIDINGYFVPASTQGALAFYPVTPCRVVDTRNPTGPVGGGPIPRANYQAFSVPNSSCGIPVSGQAYSLNVTAVPPGPLVYMTVWPFIPPPPVASTLNDVQGQVVANAAIVGSPRVHTLPAWWACSLPARPTWCWTSTATSPLREGREPCTTTR